MDLLDKGLYYQEGFSVDDGSLNVLISLVRSLFENSGLKASGRLVLMLEGSSEYKLETGVRSDDEKGARHVIHEEILCAFGNYFSVTFTQVNNSTSLIPIIYFLKKSKDFILINQLIETCEKQLPSSVAVLKKMGSKYFICSSHLLGPLWKIHEDKYRLKAHFVFSNSKEKFVWYKKENDKLEEIGEIEFLYRKLYVLNVSKFHTSCIERYDDDLPRVHLVMDLV
jgi:hypothetical protein